jgi:uncharacterized protein
MPYLIDGYNLLHAMGIIPKRTGPHGLEKARLRLLGLLQSAHRDDPGQVTVIFDAAHAPPGVPEAEDYQGIHVRFAIRHEQADELIESVIQHHSAPKQLIVVSDDHRIQQAARHRHCPVLPCLDYLDELQRRRRRRPQAKMSDEKPATARGGEDQEWLRAFAEAEEDPAFKELEYPYNLGRDQSTDAENE